MLNERFQDIQSFAFLDYVNPKLNRIKLIYLRKGTDHYFTFQCLKVNWNLTVILIKIPVYQDKWCVFSDKCFSRKVFSCLKRVKTYLRATMTQDHLSSLCLISIHKDILKERSQRKVTITCMTKYWISLLKSPEDSFLSKACMVSWEG